MEEPMPCAHRRMRKLMWPFPPHTGSVPLRHAALFPAAFLLPPTSHPTGLTCQNASRKIMIRQKLRNALLRKKQAT